MTDYRDFYRELRADWLKLRSYLFDTNTELPTLASMIDEVRRRLEGGEALGLVYIDPSNAGHLEASCGWQAYDQLLREAAAALRDYQTVHLAAADVVALNVVRGDELLAFVGLGEAPPPERLEALRADMVDRVERSLTSFCDDLHQLPRLASAAILLVPDPTVRLERSIYQALQRARELCRRESERRQSRRLTELRRMLGAGELLLRYQPIVHLQNGGIHGLEALSSAPSREFFESPEVLFTFAEESDAIVDLERLCRRQAVQRAVPLLRHDALAAGGKLFINCSAHAFADPELLPDLVQGALGAGLDPNDLVLEVTERVAITEWRIFREALANLRREGLRVAIDDMGSGYSSLHAVAEIQPDYLKFHFSLVNNIHQSSIKRNLLETLVVLAEKIGARSVAEGIETAEEFDTVREMGVRFGQGYFFAPPALPADLDRVYFPDWATG